MYDSQINDKNLIDAKKLEQYLEKAIELYIHIVAEMYLGTDNQRQLSEHW
jgi:hypothetical protein